MISNKLFLILALSLVLILFISSSVQALSISQNYDAGYTRVKDKWIYREDLTGGHRGFTLTHKYVLPTENIQVTVNDNQNTNAPIISRTPIGAGFGSFGSVSSFSSLSSFNSLGSGRNSFSSLSSSGNDRAISDAFDTYQENTRPRYGYGGGGYYSGYGNYGYGGYGYYDSWGSGVVRLGW